MNHRERTLAAVRHEIPDRVPMSWFSIEEPEPILNYLGLDSSLGVDGISKHFGADVKLLAAKAGGYSLFGNSGSQLPYGHELKEKPFLNISSVKEVENYAWPSINSIGFDLEDETGRYNLNNCEEFAVAIGNWTSVFCEICDFFGMEQSLILLYENPKLIEAAVERIEHFYLQYCERLFAAANGKADFFHMWDDFSSQRGLIMSADTWRRFFKPTIKKMFALAKKNDLYVWFHSCGVIVDVMPDLIDMGMDVWETVQVHLDGNDPDMLKREFGSHITFAGGLGTQNVLPHGTPEQVREEVRSKIRILGKGGGYLCNSDHVIKKDVPVENTIALFDEINRFRFKGCTL